MSTSYDPNTGLPHDPSVAVGGSDLSFPAPGQLPFGMPVAATTLHAPEAPAPEAPAPAEGHLWAEEHVPEPVRYSAQPIPFEELLEAEQPEPVLAEAAVAAAPVVVPPPATPPRVTPPAPVPPALPPALQSPLPVPLPAPVPVPEADATTPDRSTATLLRLLAPVLCFLALVLHFALVRWVDAWWWDTALVGLIVAGLATAGALSVRHGAASVYLAAALALPFALDAAGNLAMDLRLRALTDTAAASGADEARGSGTAQAAPADEDPIAAAVAEAVPFGTTTTLNGFEVKLLEASCGLTVVENGLPGKTYWEPGSKNQFVDADAAAGQTFCLITSSWANTTSSPLMSMLTQTIEQVRTSDGTTFAPTEQDADIARVLNADVPVGDVNPGATLTRHSVVSVPAESSAEHAVVERIDLTERTAPTVTALALK